MKIFYSILKKINTNFLFSYISPKWYKNKKFQFLLKTNISELKKNRKFEPELLLLKNYIKKNDICFDIGSNNGEYTYIFELYSGSENVYSFEPITILNKRLKLFFKKVNIVPVALSSKKKIANFKIPKINDNFYLSRGKLNIDFIEPNETSFNLVSVNCNTLDLYFESSKLNKLDFIKIDVEGHEYEVLKGGEKTIKKFKPIILIEIEQRHHDFSINEIFHFIISMGYKISFFNLLTEKFHSINEFNLNINQDYNNIKTAMYVNNFWCFPN